MTLTNEIIRKIIARLLEGEDYRVEILALINAAFLEYAIEFFKKVAEVKLKLGEITPDWYEEVFLHPDLSSNELIINAGLNKKTVSNAYGSARYEVVLDVTKEYYADLKSLIENLVERGQDVDITLTIKFRGVGIDLNISESLIVINTLAVKRAQIRGGAWSTAGKQVEIPLMLTLCHLFDAPERYYTLKGLSEQQREIDFHLIGKSPNEKYNCEVKLMGKGNPESADAVIARDTQIFIADTLSDLNKQQLDQLGIQWVELRTPSGFRRFYDVLRRLDIPCQNFTGDLDHRLEQIFLLLFG